MLRVTPLYGASLPAARPSSSSNAPGDDDDPPEWLSAPVPSCTLVEYAGMRLLLNAGWDGSLPAAAGDKTNTGNNNLGAPCSKPAAPNELPDADAVLLCDSTLASLGGLPLYFGASAASRHGRSPRALTGKGKRRKRRNPPFLATHPTAKMGQMALYDRHAALSLDGCDPGYTLEDVDAVFGRESVKTLKYSQTVYLPLEEEDEYVYNGEGEEDDGDAMDVDAPPKGGRGKSNKLLAITPHLSGHVVGGCYWVLRQLSDDTEIVLAPTYHHAKERHLAGSTLHRFGANADALVTMPGGPRGLLGQLYRPPPPIKERKTKEYKMIQYGKGNKPVLSPPVGSRSEAELVESVMAALRRDGNVLLPTDAAGRVLELLLLLDRHWERQRLGGAYNLVWVGPMARNVVEFARSQLEWMAPRWGAQFDSGRGHPYQLKAVRICASVDELDAVVEESGGNPSCVLASGAGMDHGPARDLLVRWGGNPDNLVLVTDSALCVPRGDVWFGRPGGEAKPAPAKRSASHDLLAATGGEGEKEAAEEVAPDDVSPYTTASQLLYHWCAAKAAGDEMADEVGVDVYTPRRAPLSGEELRNFLAAEEEERRRKAAEEEERAMLREVEIARGRLRLGDDEGGGSKAATAKAAGAKTGPGSAAAASTRPKKKSRFDQSLFIKFSKPVHMTFDVREEAVGIGQPDSVARHGIGESVGNAQGRGEILEDDYGIGVVAESFVDIVTGVDPGKFAGKSGRIGEEVARRGLGFAADGRLGVDAAGGAGEGNSAAKEGGGAEGINERMLEVADLSSGKGIIKGRNGRPPVKVSVVPRRLDVLAEVVYIPLEGRVDARAARQSVRALQPRHLVVIGGPKASSLSLADALRGSSAGPSGSKGALALAHAPSDGETVQLTVGHAAYGVRLIDTPYLTQEEKEEMELAGKEDIEPIEAPFEAKIGECTVSLVDFVATGKKWAVDGSIVLAPRRKLEESSLKQPSLMISTREVLLTDLRAEVTALGMKAEYGALSGYSQLIVNGKIFVRKDNVTGKLDVEGPLCDDFYTVRSVVCGQYVNV